MIPQIFLALIITLVIAGVCVYFKFTLLTTAVVTISVTFALSLFIIIGGWALVKADKLSFNEYWNGYEKEAIFQVQGCSRDSGCGFIYNCDPYQQSHVRTVSDGNGKSHTEVYFTTEYHHCPYVTEEWLFSIDTTLGSYFIAHNIPDNPTEYRSGSGVGPGTRGVPAFWQAAYDRIAAGKPGPVTKRMTYDNYLLASDKSILNQYSDQIEDLNKKNLLPKVTSSVRDFYYSDKAYFVGISPQDITKWETDLSYLNAGFGTELQGDLHLVVVATPNSELDPNKYITALKAYWTNPAVFGDNAASKNSVIVALGTDGTKITWARAITGMPLGNEYMAKDIQSKLVGLPLTADAIIGSVSSEFYKVGEKTKVRSVASNGALYRVLWGLDDPQSKFKRVSMSGGNAEDNGSGFGYLKDEIQPSDGQQALILFLALLTTLVGWVIALWYEYDLERKNRYGNYF